MTVVFVCLRRRVFVTFSGKTDLSTLNHCSLFFFNIHPGHKRLYSSSTTGGLFPLFVLRKNNTLRENTFRRLIDNEEKYSLHYFGVHSVVTFFHFPEPVTHVIEQRM